jgi:hypothetical protein
LPECIAWEQYKKLHQPLPPITELYLATEWNSRDGPTRLPRKVSTGCSLQKLLKFFSGKPKCIWVIVGFEYTENEEASSSESTTCVKVEGQPKTIRRRKSNKLIKAEEVQAQESTVSLMLLINERHNIDKA